jgi:hypothetical protein
MPLGINIKKAETEAAVRELARLTGEGLTEAIENAAREKIGRLKAQRRRERPRSLEEYFRAIAPLQEAIAKERRAKGDKRTAQELMDELYDAHGLPR